MIVYTHMLIRNLYQECLECPSGSKAAYNKILRAFVLPRYLVYPSIGYCTILQ